MIDLILWLTLRATPAEAEALHSLVPTELTVAQAAEHIYYARQAALVAGVDYVKLLAIADHESHYTPGAVTREPGHRVSCGAMTPVPKRHCSHAELTLEGGYMAGAAHYKMWLDACGGSARCADIAYAGGMVSARACTRGVNVRAPSGRSVCAVHDVLERQGARIRKALFP